MVGPLGSNQEKVRDKAALMERPKHAASASPGSHELQNIGPRHITPKQIMKDHARAFIHVAIIVSNLRSLNLSDLQETSRNIRGLVDWSSRRSQVFDVKRLMLVTATSTDSIANMTITMILTVM